MCAGGGGCQDPVRLCGSVGPSWSEVVSDVVGRAVPGDEVAAVDGSDSSTESPGGLLGKSPGESRGESPPEVGIRAVRPEVSGSCSSPSDVPSRPATGLTLDGREMFGGFEAGGLRSVEIRLGQPCSTGCNAGRAAAGDVPRRGLSPAPGYPPTRIRSTAPPVDSRGRTFGVRPRPFLLPGRSAPGRFCCPAVPPLAVPPLAVPRLAVPRLAVPRLAVPRLAVPRLAVPR